MNVQFQNQTPQQVQEKIDDLTQERDSRPTQQQLTNLQNQLTSTRQQLQKELSWWDKWINDSIIEKRQSKGWEIGKFFSQELKNWLLSNSVSFWTPQLAVLVEKGGVFCFWELSGNTDRTDVKKHRLVIKAIYEYYKNK